MAADDVVAQPNAVNLASPATRGDDLHQAILAEYAFD